MAYVAVAGFRPDGHTHVWIVAQRAGVEWVVPWLTSPERTTRGRWLGVTWQLSGAPVSQLTDELRAADSLPLTDWGGPNLARAYGTFLELVRLPKADDLDDAGKGLPMINTLSLRVVSGCSSSPGAIRGR